MKGLDSAIVAAWRAEDHEEFLRLADAIESRDLATRDRRKRAAKRRAAERRTKSRGRDHEAILVGSRPPLSERGNGARCDGCLARSSGGRRHITGGYCPTCRQRGAAFGWCACGAAAYADGTCRKTSIHRAYLSAQESEK